jgi:hypothetical protein
MADEESDNMSDTVSSTNPMRKSRTVKLAMRDIVNTVKRIPTNEYQHDIDKLILFNIMPSPRDDRDWNSEAIFNSSTRIPRSLDLRNRLNFPRDQSNQGTSAAQVAACMKEWREKKDNDFKEYMSPQFIYNNRSNQYSVGMYGRDVMNILKNAGICPESSYPYEKVETKTEIDKKLYFEAKNHRIYGYARVSTIEGLKRALVTTGPCYISFPVYNHTKRLWKQYKNCFDVGEKQLGGHAMTVVGYNSVGFIIRNSWGMFWDNDGYCMYPYTDWGCHYEIWTMVDENSYKPKKKGILSKLFGPNTKLNKKEYPKNPNDYPSKRPKDNKIEKFIEFDGEAYEDENEEHAKEHDDDFENV